MKTRWLLPMSMVLLFLAVGSHEPQADGTSQPPPHGTAADPNVIYFDQGWSEENRQEFYHKEQGTRLIPYEWWVSLEARVLDKSASPSESRCEDFKPFKADDNVSRYGLIPDSNTLKNEDKLPVGFTTSPIRDGHEASRISKKWLGFTCAACHTRLMTYYGQKFIADGGPAMLDMNKFTTAMFEALQQTLDVPPAFACFAKRVEKAGGEADPLKLSKQVKKIIEANDTTSLGTIDERDPQERLKKRGMRKAEIFPTEWGFGRLDALGRGGNTVLGALDESNIRAANAPVSFPQLWGAWEYDWVQWNGSIQNPMARNLAQVISVTRRLTFPEQEPYASDVDLGGLDELENIMIGLMPPRWRKEFPPINVAQAQQGKELYGRWCAHCHVPNTQEPNGFGQRFVMKMIPLEEIGTDPSHAFNFYSRTVNTGKLRTRLKRDTILAGDIMKYMTDEMIRLENNKRHESKQPEFATLNEWRPPLAYMARPHRAIWATAPFLHNGSVPTLYQLLLPVEKREACFYLGSWEFDPVDVGYVTSPCTSAPAADIANAAGQSASDPERLRRLEIRQAFNARLPGNSNAGHEFKDVEGCQDFITKGGKNGVLGCELRDYERWAIIEYLKTCDLELPWDPWRPVSSACPTKPRLGPKKASR